MNSYHDYQFKNNYPELSKIYNYNSKKLTQNKKNINYVITHGRCLDGFMSATIVRKWLIENKVNIDNVVFLEVRHGINYNGLCEKIKNKNVLICDYSFPISLFNDMIKATNGNILILDHHKTAEQQLATVNKKYLVFDMTHSGAFITWTFMYGFNNIPNCVLYIEDNDIWTKQLPLTREFTSYIETLPYEYKEYNNLFDESYLINTVFTQGLGMVLKDTQYIIQLSKQAITYFVEISGRYYFIACVSSSILRSDIGSHLLSYYKNINFTMIYSNNISRNYTTVSYRSNNDKTDVSLIAKINNGGGHRNASGFGISGIITQPLGNILDNGKYYRTLDNIYTCDTSYGKFVILNTQFLHKQITKYLIQKRHTDKKFIHQEGLYCMRNKMDNITLNEFYIGSVAWYYDGYNDVYTITISLLSEYNKQILNNINKYNLKNNINTHINYLDKNNNTYEFKVNMCPNDLLRIITDTNDYSIKN
jgi:hypothetical protein